MNIQNNNYDYLFKYIIVGDTSNQLISRDVGKSCLLLRFAELTFKKDHEPTLGVQFTSKLVELQAHTIKIQIWDTAGQQSFKAITRSYYKGSIAAFLVFDVTNRPSFESLHKWLYEVKNHSHQKLQIFVMGNKTDLKSSRQVTFEEAETFARNNDFSYFDVSAYNGDRVQQVFMRMTQKILRKIVSKQLNIEIDSTLGIRKGKKQKKQLVNPNGKISLGIGSQPQSKCCK